MKLKIKYLNNREDAIMHLPCLVCFCLAQILCSCTEEIYFKTNYFKNEVVVNSIITPDSLFSCHLSRLVVPLQRETSTNKTHVIVDVPIIEDAKVKIENAQTGELITKLDYNGAGWYRSSTQKPKIGVSYRLVVIVEGNDTISAQTSIPKKAKAEHFDLKYFSTLDKTVVDPDPDYSKVHTLSATIVDNAGVDDFYEIAMIKNLKSYAHVAFHSSKSRYIELKELDRLMNESNDIIADSIVIRLDTLLTYYHAFTFYCTDPVIEAESITPAISVPPTLLFSDKSFKNGMKIIATDLHFANDYGSYNGVRGDNLFCLRSLSPELFNYQQSLRKQQIAISENLFNPLTGDFTTANSQVNIETNIENGYGVFGGYSVKNYIIAEDGKLYWWHKYVVQ